ncbi:hypothetical protein PAEVO_22150 [Paenibacillus sp. GM2FR]|uniref:CUE domain-containing protein n=1 Tax=Paenibacillus sp. GM2FR TaxID=2059268 RepID=UPI000C27CBE2|nr:CUE domain-containing protein [Paenibacillus sp. GM2FR]PJN55494.1 hypothetical protein PAEVO_22150 [Paenibacillus sp. GM2FR]
MNSKFIAIVGAAVLTLGIGTAVYASEVATSTFKDMIPFMKEMHPNLSDSDLEQMYNNCHGNSIPQGMMQHNSNMPAVNSGSIYN